MIEDLLKLGCCFDALARGEIRQPADIDGL
jgi:hypothetical protein